MEPIRNGCTTRIASPASHATTIVLIMPSSLDAKLRRKDNTFINKQQNFRMWFKYGLKAQKLLAQGIALGIIAISNAPCKGNSFMYCLEF